MGLTGALLYMVLLGVGAMIVPGVGIGGSLLATLPQPVTEYAHLPAYALLTWVLANSFRERGWPKRPAMAMAAAGAMVFGIWMEVLQRFVPGRVVDIGDVALNAIGIGLATLMIEAASERRACEATPRRRFPLPKCSS